MAALTSLDEKIADMKAAADDMRSVVSEGHAFLKDLRTERREIERLLEPRAAALVEEHLTRLVKEGMAELGNVLHVQSQGIYERVQGQVDKLINLCLGPEHALGRGKVEDLRPRLAAMLRLWLRDEIVKP